MYPIQFNKSIFFFILFTFVFSCAKQIRIETTKDENGNTLEEYQVTLKTNKKHGIYKRYNPQGILEELTNYKNGIQEGERILFFPDGKVMTKEFYSNGSFFGDYSTYFPNGQMESKGKFIDGAMNGEWQYFYKNGQIKEIVNFENNEENGPFKEFYPNGNLKTEGTYKTSSINIDGYKEHGTLLMYGESGELEKKMECNFGVCKTIWTNKK